MPFFPATSGPARASSREGYGRQAGGGGAWNIPAAGKGRLLPDPLEFRPLVPESFPGPPLDPLRFWTLLFWELYFRRLLGPLDFPWRRKGPSQDVAGIHARSAAAIWESITCPGITSYFYFVRLDHRPLSDVAVIPFPLQLHGNKPRANLALRMRHPCTRFLDSWQQC
uniref:Uncharacterized protein n=1 Tax=Sphaerodactylus townsendi TaxID=933632 RepID=A0ACB8G7E0_9SAUR